MLNNKSGVQGDRVFADSSDNTDNTYRCRHDTGKVGWLRVPTFTPQNPNIPYDYLICLSLFPTKHSEGMDWCYSWANSAKSTSLMSLAQFHYSNCDLVLFGPTFQSIHCYAIYIESSV